MGNRGLRRWVFRMWGLRHSSTSHTEMGPHTCLLSTSSQLARPAPPHLLLPRNTGLGFLELNECGQHSCHQSWDRTQECDIPKARNSIWHLAFS